LICRPFGHNFEPGWDINPAARGKEKFMARKTNKKGGFGGRTQTFSFRAPEASSVQLVGNFTQWLEHPINLQKGADGVWQTAVPLPPGTYHYRFFVDGAWRDDPACTQRTPNPFGGEDMTRQVA
jgi:1,4-alpha-glucan branching enzyme